MPNNDTTSVYVESHTNKYIGPNSSKKYKVFLISYLAENTKTIGSGTPFEIITGLPVKFHPVNFNVDTFLVCLLCDLPDVVIYNHSRYIIRE